ncbi:MAG: hypothetical protein Q8K36_05225 [Alphaproteobacteria bacterium]|nr:hypothetical protein [Alphaproteobacteria bacterium]
MTLTIIASLLLCVLYFDLIFFIIPNFIPLGIAIVAFMHIGMFAESFDAVHFMLPLGILFAGLILAYFNIMGFGDTKLIASMSIILGVQSTVSLLLYTMVLGMVWAIVFVLFKKYIRRLREYLYTKHSLYSFHKAIIPDLDHVIIDARQLQEQNYLPYGLAIAPVALYMLYSHALP